MATLTSPGLGGGTSLYTRDARGNAVLRSTSTTTTSADASLLRSSVSDILGLRALATSDAANATAADIEAKGYGLEADAYGKVSDIALENAGLAGVAGEIKRLQEARTASRTIGSQKAAIASAGFGASGSSLDLLRSSLQDSMLSDQLISTQTALNVGGYRAEGAAADASGAGAAMASDSAVALAKKYRASGALSTANAAAQTDALSAYIKSSGSALTPAQQLALGSLAADPTIAGSFSVTGAGSSTVTGIGGMVSDYDRGKAINDQSKAMGLPDGKYIGIGKGATFY